MKHTSEPACEIATPTLAALEWASSAERLNLPREALAKMADLVDAAPEPNARLRAAAKRRRR